MPNIKSAKKRVKVIASKSANNKAIVSNLKTVLKKADAAIESSADNKLEQVQTAIKKIDQVASKGLMHKNTASRKKSALVKKLNKA